MTVFTKPGIENTDATLRIALEAAVKHNLPIVMASNTGTTTEKLLKLQQESGLSAPIVMVGQVYGFPSPARTL